MKNDDSSSESSGGGTANTSEREELKLRMDANWDKKVAEGAVVLYCRWSLLQCSKQGLKKTSTDGQVLVSLFCEVHCCMSLDCVRAAKPGTRYCEDCHGGGKVVAAAAVVYCKSPLTCRNHGVKKTLTDGRVLVSIFCEIHCCHSPECVDASNFRERYCEKCRVARLNAWRNKSQE